MNQELYQKMRRDANILLTVGGILTVMTGMMCSYAFVYDMYQIVIVILCLFGTLFLCSCAILAKGLRKRKLCRQSCAYGCWLTAGGVLSIETIAMGMGEESDHTLQSLETLMKLGMFPDAVLWNEERRVHCSDSAQAQEGAFHESCIDHQQAAEAGRKSILRIVLCAILACFCLLWGLSYLAFALTRTAGYWGIFLYFMLLLAICGTIIVRSIQKLYLCVLFKQITAQLRSTDSLAVLSETLHMPSERLLHHLRRMMLLGFFHGIRIDRDENRLRFPAAAETKK